MRSGCRRASTRSRSATRPSSRIARPSTCARTAACGSSTSSNDARRARQASRIDRRRVSAGVRGVRGAHHDGTRRHPRARRKASLRLPAAPPPEARPAGTARTRRGAREKPRRAGLRARREELRGRRLQERGAATPVRAVARPAGLPRPGHRAQVPCVHRLRVGPAAAVPRRVPQGRSRPTATSISRLPRPAIRSGGPCSAA